MLIIGIFIMFYIAHKRIWLHLTEENGQTRMIMAGSGNRRNIDYDKDFDELLEGGKKVLNIK